MRMDLLYSESMLTERDRRRLERQRDALIQEVRGLGNLMRGTVVEVGVRCGRPGCVCTQGAKHRKLHLSVNLQGRTQGCYLGQEREAAVAPLLAEYQRAWRLINDLTAVNLALLRGGHPGGRKGRRAT
jgi:transposase